MGPKTRFKVTFAQVICALGDLQPSRVAQHMTSDLPVTAR